MEHTHNPSAWSLGLGIQGQPHLHNEFEVSLRYIKPDLPFPQNPLHTKRINLPLINWIKTSPCPGSRQTHDINEELTISKGSLNLEEDQAPLQVYRSSKGLYVGGTFRRVTVFLKVTLARQGGLGCRVFSGLFIHSLSGVSKNSYLMENIAISSSTFCSVWTSIGWMLPATLGEGDLHPVF